MYSSNLRKVGGSIMLAIPPVVLNLLHLNAGATVNLAIEGSNLVVQPATQTIYTIEQLLAQCDANAPMSAEDSEWLSSPAVGLELI